MAPPTPAPAVHEYANLKLANAVPPGVDEGDLALEQENLVLLPHLHEPAMLHVICQRFAMDCIYTYTGEWTGETLRCS